MRDLTKWPRLLVRGVTVSEEQADEILIRTCVPAYLNGNDRQWGMAVRRVMGLQDDEAPRELYETGRHEERIAWLKEKWAFNDARSQELGLLGLDYLYTSQIASSWIGGPHGWCDWNGRIFCNTYNIGKWPSTEEVTEEWTDIAEAFPFLDLTAQLISNEGGYEDHPGELAGQWRVKDGAVTHEPEPVKQIVPLPTEEEYEHALKWAVADIANGRPDRERGVRLERLVQAVDRVERKMKMED